MKKIFLLLVLSSHAFGFTLIDRAEPKWHIREITVRYDESACLSSYPLSSLLQDALDMWNSVPWTNIKLVNGGTNTSNITAYEGIIIVICDASVAAGLGGLASPGYSGSGVNPPIQGSVVRISANPSATLDWSTASRDVKVGVLAHEIGHSLGIGHSRSTGSIMSPTGTGFVNDDDRAALQYLYPRDEKNDGGFYGCGRVSSHVSPPTVGNVLSFLMVPLAILILTRIRRLQRRSIQRV